jgi:hypothetical protein
MKIFMIGAWTIWNERNNFIFNQIPTSGALWKATFKAEVIEHFIIIKKELHQPIDSWLNAL